MRNSIKIVFTAIVLALSQPLQAQQWSDVGDPGFTVSNQTLTNPQFAYKMAMYNDVPYMAYITTAGDIAVMKYSAGIWAALPTPSTGTSTAFVQMAFDATGNLYLGYLGTSSNAFVKKFNGSVWSTVGTGAIVQDNINGLAINPATQEPYIAVYDGGGTQKATVYRFNGTSWVTVGPAQFSGQTQALRLAISSAGVPYLTLQDGNFGTTFSVQKFDGTNWVAVGPASVGNLGANIKTDIIIDASGTPYVFSTNPSNSNKANVLKFNGTAWVAVGQADFSAGAAEQPFFKFDNAGVLHVAFQDGASANGANKATVMKFNGTSWVGVGNAGLSGAGVYFPSLAFNSSNQPFIGFRDASTTGAKGTVMKLCASSTATVSSTTPGFVCSAGSVTLSATSAGTLKWYSAATNGSYVGSGTTYTTPSITTTTTYSVAAYDGNGCSSPRTVVIASVNPVPTISGSTPGSRCGAGTVSISATPSAGVVNWFTTSSGGSVVGTGTSFTTPGITANTTYYAEANNGGCTSAARTAVIATINPIPTLTTTNAFACGSGSMQLTASSPMPGATFAWYSAPAGGTSLTTVPTLNTPNLSVTTNYYAEAILQGCVSATRVLAVAEVRPRPTVTSTTPAERCGDGTLTLAMTTNGDANGQWYTTSTGGTPINTTKVFATPALTNTTTYYAEAFDNGCASASRTAVVATIKPIPTISSSDVSRCDAGTVTFEATSNGSISWFAAASGGSALGTGSNFTTPSVTITTPYFIEAVLNGCITTNRTSVSAIVNNSPAQPTITQNNSNIEAPVLTSSSTTGNQWFRNDTPISGATNATYVIAESGSYKVQLNTNGCQSPFSSAVIYVVTGVEDLAIHTQVYPNPVQDELVIDLGGINRNDHVSIALVDFLGRQIQQTQANGGDEIRLSMKTMVAGRYIVLITHGNQRISKSIIKSF